MAWTISMSARIGWVPDGADSMSVMSAQSLVSGPVTQQVVGTVAVPPTTSTINTAVLAAAAQVSTLMQAQVGVIDGWSTGNP